MVEAVLLRVIAVLRAVDRICDRISHLCWILIDRSAAAVARIRWRRRLDARRTR